MTTLRVPVFFTISAIGPSWLQALVSSTASTSHFRSALDRIAAENLHVVIRIDERNVRRHGIGVHDSHRLAERAESESQADLAADGIAIRPHVAGEHERLRFAYNFREWAPINGH